MGFRSASEDKLNSNLHRPWFRGINANSTEDQESRGAIREKNSRIVIACTR